MVHLVECNPDRIIVKTLTSAPKEKIIHSGNKSDLIKNLTKNYTDSEGLIDEDPGSSQPRLLQRFQEVESLEEDDLKILYYRDRNNYLVVLRPRLENWVLRAARESNVDVKAYGLPDDAIELHALVNAHSDKFEELIGNLKRSRRLTALSRILMNYPYE